MSAEPVETPGVRGVLARPLFRRLWAVLCFASLADWLGLLALTAVANAYAGGDASDRSLAIASVLFLRVVPALVIGPLGGYVADRLDRRTTLLAGMVLRGALYASILLVGELWWVLVATVLVEAVNAVWLPTKDATVPDLVPAAALEDANRLNLATTYGAAVPAAGVFVALAGVGGPDAALIAVAALYLAGAPVAWMLRDLPRAAGAGADAGVVESVGEGLAYVWRTPTVRWLAIGVVGAFAAGGVVIGLGRVFVDGLGGDEPAYGLLFGGVFAGLGAGMWFGPRVTRRWAGGASRGRIFASGLVAAGVLLGLLAAVEHLELALVAVVLIGTVAGVSWVAGYTILGSEVEPELRGRTFAFVQSAVRVVLALVLAAAPALAGLVGSVRLDLGPVDVTWSGTQVAFLVAAVGVVLVGLVAYGRIETTDPDLDPDLAPGATLDEASAPPADPNGDA